MKAFRQKLFWIIPLLIVIIGFVVLFFTNLYRFTAPPADDWSRGLEITTIDGFHEPQVEETKDGTNLYFLRDGAINRISYDSDFTKVDEEVIPTEGDRIEDFYVNGDTVFYFNEGEIINGRTGEIIDEADIFERGQEGNILYSSDQKVYNLETNAKEPQQIAPVSHPIEHIQSSGPYVLVYAINGNEGTLTIFEKMNNEYKRLTQTNINVGISNKMNDIVFTSEEEQLHLAVSAETESNQNKEFYFFHSTLNAENPDINLKEIEPYDPVTQAPLEEISQFRLRPAENGAIEVLFRSAGFTFTDSNDEQAMNVYLMRLENDNSITVERRSNTYALTSNPFFIGEDAVGWKDRIDGTQYKLLMASNQPDMIEKAKDRSANEYLIAFGMTIGNLSTAAFILYLALLLIIIPIIYLGGTALYYRWKGKGEELDNHPKILYGGIIVYIIGALLFRHHLFPDNAYNLAPIYINFPGNSMVYIVGFAILSFISIKLIKKDWGLIGKYSYFIGLQFLLYVMFLGPYYF
ncbi:hypothetical protein SAMN05421676_11556 [Salinibacillus kushneri]|uniref:Uncharacterized protein n=1 Tax=Salinibacillus kushneri TaxID=237682 RepID=A0A1I0J1S1_9BACI|nr:hypothetical protein [Salinibacillus kushneri]SEU03645.1 hypothetical protein SAMN05421676_11556 [Salinibacillus kushneri]